MGAIPPLHGRSYAPDDAPWCPLHRWKTATACTVTNRLTKSWTGGFQADVLITNTGATAVSGWQLLWAFGGDQKISNIWNATGTQSGTHVTINNAGYNGTIAAGASTDIGLTGTYSTSNAAPGVHSQRHRLHCALSACGRGCPVWRKNGQVCAAAAGAELAAPGAPSPGASCHNGKGKPPG